jgi:hypothetical protein
MKISILSELYKVIFRYIFYIKIKILKIFKFIRKILFYNYILTYLSILYGNYIKYFRDVFKAKIHL